MTNNKNKSMMISTIVLFIGVVVISLYSFTPTNSTNKVLEKFRINFDDEGKSIAAIEIESGKFITRPEDPVRDGYIFVGWEVDGELFDFSKEVNENVNLVARWQKVEPDKVYFTVVFNTDGGSTIGNQVVEENNLATRPNDDPVKEGFTFVGWQMNGSDFDFNIPITGNITITAIWEEVVVEPETPTPENPEEPEEKTFTVRFNGNGGTLGNGCSAQTVKSGETAKSTCTATRNGYTLVGFNTNSKATSAQNVGTRKITANTTYYAIWKQNQVVAPEPPKAEKISVTFNFNGGNAGTCNGAGMQVDKGTKGSDIKCAPTRQYYKFVGWSIQGVLYSNATLTAQWSKRSFTISGKEITDGTTASGHTISITGTDVNANLVEYIEICAGTRCQKATPQNKMSTNKVSFYNNMTSCTVKFTDSNETFSCGK